MGSVGDVGGASIKFRVDQKNDVVAWVKILMWVAWVHKILAWVNKKKA